MWAALQGPDYSAFRQLALDTDDVDFIQTSAEAVASAAGMKGSKLPAFAMVTEYEAFGKNTVHSKGHAAFQAADGDTELALQVRQLLRKLKSGTVLLPATGAATCLHLLMRQWP